MCVKHILSLCAEGGTRRDRAAHRITESQKGWGWKKSSGGQLALQPISQDHAHTAPEYLQGWTFPTISGQSVTVLSLSSNKKMLHCAQTVPPVFQFVPVSSYHWDWSGAEKQGRGFWPENPHVEQAGRAANQASVYGESYLIVVMELLLTQIHSNGPWTALNAQIETVKAQRTLVLSVRCQCTDFPIFLFSQLSNRLGRTNVAWLVSSCSERTIS